MRDTPQPRQQRHEHRCLRMRAHPPFANVRWSSAHTLSDVVANLRDRRRLFLRELEDVDDAASLARVRTLMRLRL